MSMNYGCTDIRKVFSCCAKRQREGQPMPSVAASPSPGKSPTCRPNPSKSLLECPPTSPSTPHSPNSPTKNTPEPHSPNSSPRSPLRGSPKPQSPSSYPKSHPKPSSPQSPPCRPNSPIPNHSPMCQPPIRHTNTKLTKTRSCKYYEDMVEYSEWDEVCIKKILNQSKTKREEDDKEWDECYEGQMARTSDRKLKEIRRKNAKEKKRNTGRQVRLPRIEEEEDQYEEEEEFVYEINVLRLH